jgi:hypothetical protein
MTARRPPVARLAAGALAVVGALGACAPGSSGPGEAAGSGAATTSASTPVTSVTPTPTTTSTTTPARRTTTTSRPTPSPTTTTRRPRPAGPERLPAVPRAGAEPTVRFPRNEPASGRGANATVAPVPDGLWSQMVGTAWTPGCPVGRSGLRVVRVNFWGFDGVRSRGTLVVNASIADATARAFTRLYDLRFRIRQIRPMDGSWGAHPKGPGADDYAAMEADDTSAFNCRYVGGEEEKKQYSRHAYGLAIDVNPFENPYLAPDGAVYPDPWWSRRRAPAPGVFSSSGSAAVRAFTSQGFGWGGLWAHPDYQHFDVR